MICLSVQIMGLFENFQMCSWGLLYLLIVQQSASPAMAATMKCSASEGHVHISKHVARLTLPCALQDCMSFGKPMLIENIEEELDPMLDPVLEKRLIKKGRSFIMPMADKEVGTDPMCILIPTHYFADVTRGLFEEA